MGSSSAGGDVRAQGLAASVCVFYVSVMPLLGPFECMEQVCHPLCWSRVQGVLWL
ncbi:Uncharacterised protein [Chlamydia abortus]|nr:Uncharacterised protein [Chlamydia abortus]